MALNNSQYESIIKGYERARDESRFLLDSRKQQVWREIPEYRQLSESIGSVSVSYGRRMLEGDEGALSELHVKLAEIASRQKQLLTEHGFPADYLEPVYSCPDCQDTGFLQSGLFREKCHCFRQQELSILYAQSNIQETIGRENFSTLSYAYYQGEDLRRFEAAVDISKNFIENFKDIYHNLFFYGTVGTGKSFLSCCIAKELIDQGNLVIYFSASQLFDILSKSTFDRDSTEAASGISDDICDCDLLIIDDLGTELTNAFVSSQLFSCLNSRHLRKKATIITTNLSLGELRDRYSDRIFSRITSNYDICKLTGSDIRMQKKTAAANK